MSEPRPPAHRMDEQAENVQLTVCIDELKQQGRIDRELIAYLRDEVANGELGIEHLEAALASCRRIGAAIGIVMNATNVTEDQAFATISAISQQRNVKLRQVADDVVLTGTL